MIIPVRDDAAGLRECLEALAGQTLADADYEVVVVDDDSKERVDVAGWRVPAHLRLVRCAERNSFAARNRGAEAATGEFLAFCDADCRPAERWLEQCLRTARADRLVAGAVTMKVAGAPTWWTLLDLGAYLDQAALVPTCRAVTANLVVSRAAFDAAGGFDTSQASGGDFAFTERCCAAGYELVFSRACEVEHPTRDGAGRHLGKLWRDDRAFAARRQSSLGSLAVRWTPVGELWWRSRNRRPLVLDGERAAGLGLQPSRLDRCGVALLRYGVLPLWRAAAQGIGYATNRS